MSAVDFDYTANDQASATIDRITNKMHGLKREYGEVRRSMGNIKQGLSALSGLGIGVATSAMTSLGIKKDKEEKGMFSAGNESTLSTIARSGTMIGASIVGNMVGEGLFSRLGNMGMGTGRIAGFAGRLLGGGVAFAAALGAQLAYENVVAPTIDEIFKENVYSDDYLKTLSNRYLTSSDATLEQDIYDQTIAEQTGQNFLIRQLLGFNERDSNNLAIQLSRERGNRFNEIANAMWLMYRE